MPDFQNLDVYSNVTLVDRAGQGGAAAEFIYDGIRFPFVNDDGVPTLERTFPQFVAEFVFRSEKHRVWTKPEAGADRGQYVNRYGIKACPRKLIELWGPEVADVTPIEIDPDVLEGSEAPLYRTGPVRAESVNIPPSERPGRDRQGRRAAITTGA